MGFQKPVRQLTAQDLGIADDDPGWMTEADVAQYAEDSFEFFKEIGILVPVDPASIDPAEYP